MGDEAGYIPMDARMLDVTSGIASLAVFIIALVALPKLVPAVARGAAYIIAIVIYIAFMTGTGLLIREKIA